MSPGKVCKRMATQLKDARSTQSRIKYVLPKCLRIIRVVELGCDTPAITPYQYLLLLNQVYTFGQQVLTLSTCCPKTVSGITISILYKHVITSVSYNKSSISCPQTRPFFIGGFIESVNFVFCENLELFCKFSRYYKFCCQSFYLLSCKVSCYCHWFLFV